MKSEVGRVVEQVGWQMACRREGWRSWRKSTIQVRLPFSAFCSSASFPPDAFKHRINLSHHQPSCFVIVRVQLSAGCRPSKPRQACSVVDTLLVAAAEANKPSQLLLIPLDPLTPQQSVENGGWRMPPCRDLPIEQILPELTAT
jgi:hypothetical protein